MQKLFNPTGIAVVGASSNPAAIGGKPIVQLQNHDFQGNIYPVNPKRDEVLGLKCYPSLGDIDGAVDLVIIAVPAVAVPAVLEAAGAKGIEYAVVLSSGFADAGGDGLDRQAELAEVARRAGVRVVGPNCVGFISTHHKNYAGFGAFFDYDYTPGPVGFVTQSGGVGGSLLTVADEQGVRFSHFVHTGNAMDIDIETVLASWVEDPEVNSLVAYIEGLGDGGTFPQVAERALEAKKPLLVWKAGQSEASASAVVSHTGRMAGDMERYRSVFKKYGVIEVSDSQDMIDVLKISQEGHLPKGGRVGVISVSGGAGVVAADCLATSQALTLAEFPENVEEEIAAEIPGFATAKNPVDVTAQIFSDPELFQRVVQVLSKHDAADQILACVASVHSEVGLKVAQAIVDASEAMAVPIVVAWSARDELNGAAFELLAKAGIPVFKSPERALKAMDRYTAYADVAAKYSKIETADAPQEGGTSWDRTVEFDVLEDLRKRGLTVPKQALVQTAAEAVSAAESMSYPVVVKLQSPDVPHKAAAGAIRLGLGSADEVQAAAEHMLQLAASRSGDEMRGVLVQQMADPGTELILGYLKDASLGGFFLLGKGGSGVEEMGDRVLLPAPVSYQEVKLTLDELNVVRDEELSAEALDNIATAVLTLQQVVADSSPDLGEIEVNPVIIRENTVTAVDALAAHAQ